MGTPTVTTAAGDASPAGPATGLGRVIVTGGASGLSRARAAEMAGRVGVTLLVPGGMATAFFDGRDEQYKPPPDAKLNRPEDVAAAVLFALRQPPGCEVREMVVCPSMETSWP